MRAYNVSLMLVVLLGANCGGRQVPAVSNNSGDAPAASKATVIVTTLDAQTSGVVTSNAIVGYRRGAELSAVTPSGANVAPDGVHRFEVDPSTTQLKLFSEGYSAAWTESLKLTGGAVTTTTVRMARLARLVVRVNRKDGKPLATGTLLLVTESTEETLVVHDGLVEKEVDAARGMVVVDPDLMPGFGPQEKHIVLRPGQRTDVTLTLED